MKYWAMKAPMTSWSKWVKNFTLIFKKRSTIARILKKGKQRETKSNSSREPEPLLGIKIEPGV